MTYPEFSQSISTALRKHPRGLTWKELRETLRLPYDRACPEWTCRMEKELGLIREKGSGQALIWRVKNR